MLFLLSSLFINTVNAESYQHIEMHQSEYNKNYSKWYSQPEVIICSDMTDFTINQVRYALAAWPKSTFKKISISKNCNYDIERGKIKIVDGKHVDFGDWAYTKYLYQDIYVEGHKTKLFKGAVVQLNKNVKDITLLIHEIGHAYGYEHYDEKQDVMNSYLRFYALPM